ncbi:MAG TPA: hypothetical protein VFQ15_01050 [Jiangellaceae bacterium]|nr:hypothetical protein [Jiangellaceae bacterium]
MAALTEYLVCGCPADTRRPLCGLALAEQIAFEAADVALNTGTHRLITALVTLHGAELLRDLPADPVEVLEGLLDCLWESGLLGPAEDPQSTRVEATGDRS